MTNLAPRFIAYGAAPRFGGRDEYIGMTAEKVIATAETVGWLNHQLAYWDSAATDGWDISIRVIDNAPERDLANWGPALPARHDEVSWEIWGREAYGSDASDDLPF